MLTAIYLDEVRKRQNIRKPTAQPVPKGGESGLEPENNSELQLRMMSKYQIILLLAAWNRTNHNPTETAAITNLTPEKVNSFHSVLDEQWKFFMTDGVLDLDQKINTKNEIQLLNMNDDLSLFLNAMLHFGVIKCHEYVELTAQNKTVFKQIVEDQAAAPTWIWFFQYIAERVNIVELLEMIHQQMKLKNVHEKILGNL